MIEVRVNGNLLEHRKDGHYRIKVYPPGASKIVDLDDLPVCQPPLATEVTIDVRQKPDSPRDLSMAELIDAREKTLMLSHKATSKDRDGLRYTFGLLCEQINRRIMERAI